MINVYIMSGPPGVGKSFQVKGFANVMDREGKDGIIVSSDHYHCPELTKRLGQDVYYGIPFSLVNSETLIQGYEFSIDGLPAAHQQCMRAFVDALVATKNNIIVDNTNINRYEIAPYYLVGEAFGAEVEILRVEAGVEACVMRNIHGVPSDTIRRMHMTFSETHEDGNPKQHLPWWNSRTL